MTFTSLLAQLDAFDPNLALVFSFDGTEIGAGYHVTELRHLKATGLDCGGTIKHWDEAKVQLFDLPGKTHMSVGKFKAIVSQSLQKLPELAHAELSVEYAPNNIGLRSLSVSAPQHDKGRVLIALQHKTALCKPLQRHQPETHVGSACCA